jgi:hypothetical protein
MEKSGAQIGAENVETLRAYLQSGQQLPIRAGKLNISAVALACRFDRDVLYKNPAAKALIDAAVASIAADPVSAEVTDNLEEKPIPRDDRKDRRIMRLEQENASLRAENQMLRERLRQIEHVEEVMVQSGRWVAS